jgi:hypothetical protein
MRSTGGSPRDNADKLPRGVMHLAPARLNEPSRRSHGGNTGGQGGRVVLPRRDIRVRSNVLGGALLPPPTPRLQTVN